MTTKSYERFVCDVCGAEVTKTGTARPNGWRQVTKPGASYYCSTYYDVCKECFARLDPDGKLTPKKKERVSASADREKPWGH